VIWAVGFWSPDCFGRTSHSPHHLPP
jgi:hypothetical protein